MTAFQGVMAIFALYAIMASSLLTMLIFIRIVAYLSNIRDDLRDISSGPGVPATRKVPRSGASPVVRIELVLDAPTVDGHGREEGHTR